MQDMIRAGRSLTGERQPRAKLSWSKVREARLRYADGAQASELARAYGVSLRTMRQCLAGETWIDRPNAGTGTDGRP